MGASYKHESLIEVFLTILIFRDLNNHKTYFLEFVDVAGS